MNRKDIMLYYTTVSCIIVHLCTRHYLSVHTLSPDECAHLVTCAHLDMNKNDIMLYYTMVSCI